MTAPTLLRGGRAAAERAAAEKAASDKARKSSFNTWDYLRLGPPAEGDVYGESTIVRLVQDEPEWIEVKQHGFVKTKPAPADKPADKKWPATMGAVCRYTLVSDGNGGTKRWYEDCVIDDKHLAQATSAKGALYDKKPGTRLWAVAVEREPILGTQEMADAGEIESFEVGSPVGYKDVEVERTDKDGNTVIDKRWLVLNFATENFFDKLLGNYNVYKTVLDRDYQITRKGSGTDTSYDIVALEPQMVDLGGKTVKFDLRRSEFAEQYQPPFDLAEIVAEQASDDHYNWFFNDDVESSWEARFGKKDDNAATSSDPAPATAAEKSANKANLEAMKARMGKSAVKANA